MVNEVKDSKLESFITSLGKPKSEGQIDSYNALGNSTFPTSKNEYWKYTRVTKIANKNFSLYNQSTEHYNVTDEIISKDYIVVVNGIVREDLSQFSKSKFKIEFNEVASEKKLDSDVFALLNEAYSRKNISISLDKGSVSNTPLQIIFVSAEVGIFSPIRMSVNIGDNADGEIITTFVSRQAKESFVNFYSDIKIGQNAGLKYHKFQVESDEVFHLSNDNASQEKDSRFTINTNTLNGNWVRNNLNIQVNGQNCETFLNGIVMGKENQHIDNHTFVDHKVSNCVSNENYKYVMDGKSTGVFNGKVIVRKDAQQINAFQNNANVLLSDTASINSKPELEIYADDVKCSHGSTTGQLDEQAIYYLQTRGISKKKAEKMLVSAFIAEIIESYQNESVREYLFKYLETNFGWEF